MPVQSTSSSNLSRGLGVRRWNRLSRIAKQTVLPPEALLDLAIELLERLAVHMPRRSSRLTIPAGLATARWSTMTPEARSEALRKVALARWRRESNGPTTEAPAPRT